METEHPLLAFARLYIDRLPDSEVKALPGPEQDAVTAFFGGVDWYCEKWPGRDYVIFFSDTESAGMMATHCVDIAEGSVARYPLLLRSL
jgi:hypothetical protein